MIKLVNLLNEMENHSEIDHHEMRVHHHLKEILKSAIKALKTKDSLYINKHIDSIMRHAELANYKHQISHDTPSIDGKSVLSKVHTSQSNF
jgi:hypothetical protein